MLMKRMLFAWIAMAGCLTIGWSCSDSDTDDGATGGSEIKAELLTYGFYAEDNASLTQDYVATVDREMIIRIPGEVDKTALVARFTTTEGAEVLVGSTPQVSGVTPNDFSYPVDYIVKGDGGVSNSYTVRVGKILEKEWKEVAVYNDNGFENDAFAMCISPKDNTPYFFLTRVNADEVEAGVVASFNGSTMSAGSEFTFNSENTLIDASKFDITVDADGKVYAAYYNSAKLSDDTYDRKIYVYTGSGSSWTQVGSKFGYNNNGSVIEIDPATNRPIVAFQSNDASAAVPKRSLAIVPFDGQSWGAESEISDIKGKYIYGYKMRVFNNTLYLGGLVQNAPGSYFVFKYDNGSWQPVANALPAGMSQTNMVGSSFAVASDGTAYICCGGDEDSNGTWYITVYKCAPGESDWTRIATPIVDKTGSGMSTSSKFLIDLYNDQPVVLYKNLDTGIPQVVMLNAETKQWDDPVALGTVEAGSDFALEFDANGVGYAAFLDKGELSSLHVYKFDTEEDDLPE